MAEFVISEDDVDGFDKDAIQDLLDAVRELGGLIRASERRLLDSFEIQLTERGFLTPKQMTVLRSSHSQRVG